MLLAFLTVFFNKLIGIHFDGNNANWKDRIYVVITFLIAVTRNDFVRSGCSNAYWLRE